MNISPEIMEYAEKLGLEAVATGGDCDYIWSNNGSSLIVLLVSADGFDSPSSLEEPSVLCISFNEDSSTDLSFPTAKKAMEAMKSMGDRA